MALDIAQGIFYDNIDLMPVLQTNEKETDSQYPYYFVPAQQGHRCGMDEYYLFPSGELSHPTPVNPTSLAIILSGRNGLKNPLKIHYYDGGSVYSDSARSMASYDEDQNIMNIPIQRTYTYQNRGGYTPIDWGSCLDPLGIPNQHAL